MCERNSTIFKSNGSIIGTQSESGRDRDIVVNNGSSHDRDIVVKSREGSVIRQISPQQNGSSTKNKLSGDNNLLQISIPNYQQQYVSKKGLRNLLPSNVTIPVGLAQVFIGSSMVVCGSLAFRYRSYLFYYGTGLWAGTITGLTGALGIMCTKKGLPTLRSMCGGHKWQLHVFVASTMLALTSSVLLSIFSTSGLMQDTHYTVEGREVDNTIDDDVFEKRKTAGVAINAVLLLLAMLEILLAFCSFGIILRLVCKPKEKSSSMNSSDSIISQMTMRDILGSGSGPEYEARKDRLFRWLTHQGRNLFMNSSSAASSPRNHHPNSKNAIIQNGHFGNHMMVPHLVAIQPPGPTFVPNAPSSRRMIYHRPQPHQILIPHIEPTNYYPGMGPMPVLMGPPPPHLQHPSHLVPICPMPIRQRPPPSGYSMGTLESRGGVSISGPGPGKRMVTGKRRSKIGSAHGSISNSSFKSGNSISKRNSNNNNRAKHIINNTSSSSCRSTSSSSRARKKIQKREQQQITEEEIEKTYTGLDRTLAEDFICSSMDKY